MSQAIVNRVHKIHNGQRVYIGVEVKLEVLTCGQIGDRGGNELVTKNCYVSDKLL